MSDVQLCERLLYLDKLIDREATGTPEQLAARLGMSLPTLFRYLARLRATGGSIAYCPQRQIYYYLLLLYNRSKHPICQPLIR